MKLLKRLSEWWQKREQVRKEKALEEARKKPYLHHEIDYGGGRREKGKRSPP